jgi:hypothetical protein
MFLIRNVGYKLHGASVCKWSDQRPENRHVEFLNSRLRARTRTRTHTQTHIDTRTLASYRGADKSLVWPGRKQTNISVRISWASFGTLPCRKKVLDKSSLLDVVEIARVPDMLRAFFLRSRAKDLSAPGIIADHKILKIHAHHLLLLPAGTSIQSALNKSIFQHIFYHFLWFTAYKNCVHYTPKFIHTNFRLIIQ